MSSLNKSNMFLRIMFYFFQLCAASHASEILVKTDISEYARLMLDDKHRMLDNDDRSLSIYNNPQELDKSVITSFADAFLWASGIRAKLTNSEVSRLNIVYLQKSPWTDDLEISNHEIKSIFQQNFTLIKESAPCARVDLSNSEGKKFTIVYLDSKQSYDARYSCIYRNFRALYGISEKYQMPDFSSTFVADLRILRCKYRNTNINIVQALYSGLC